MTKFGVKTEIFPYHNFWKKSSTTEVVAGGGAEAPRAATRPHAPPRFGGLFVQSAESCWLRFDLLDF